MDAAWWAPQHVWVCIFRWNLTAAQVIVRLCSPHTPLCPLLNYSSIWVKQHASIIHSAPLVSSCPSSYHGAVEPEGSAALAGVQHATLCNRHCGGICINSMGISASQRFCKMKKIVVLKEEKSLNPRWNVLNFLLLLVVFLGAGAQQLSELLHIGGESSLTPVWRLHLDTFAGTKAELTI